MNFNKRLFGDLRSCAKYDLLDVFGNVLKIEMIYGIKFKLKESRI